MSDNAQDIGNAGRRAAAAARRLTRRSSGVCAGALIAKIGDYSPMLRSATSARSPRRSAAVCISA